VAGGDLSVWAALPNQRPQRLDHYLVIEALTLDWSFTRLRDRIGTRMPCHSRPGHCQNC
jgi:hypothetical protein